MWLENKFAALDTSKDFILGFLRDKLGITDDETILSTPLNGIKDTIWKDLLGTGVVKSADPDIIQRIQNKSGTVQDLVDLMAGAGTNTPASTPAQF